MAEGAGVDGIGVIGLLTDGTVTIWDGVSVEGNVTAGRAVDGTGVICGGVLGVGTGVIGRTVDGTEVDDDGGCGGGYDGGGCEATTVDRGGVLATHVGAFALTEFEVCAFPETLLALTE